MIRYNPGIILVSLILLVVFISFSIVWIIFFNRLWLIGHLGDASSLSGAIWIVNNYVYSLAAFYVFIYMWTAKLLIYMERYFFFFFFDICIQSFFFNFVCVLDLHYLQLQHNGISIETKHHPLLYLGKTH
ncbi:MAG: hypothetical protein JSY10_29530 [Paenibacillus sp.]|nr:hypothetical protein [Paenibacillus sp.]